MDIPAWLKVIKFAGILVTRETESIGKKFIFNSLFQQPLLYKIKHIYIHISAYMYIYMYNIAICYFD